MPTPPTAALVKELRERTGAGMMDCKKALIEADGDIELAIDSMLKTGAIKAARKSQKQAEDGIIAIQNDGSYGCIVEVNCQTDFVAKDLGFIEFAGKVSKAAFDGRVTEIGELEKSFEEERACLLTKTGEAIVIRRVAGLKGEQLTDYTHGGRIGVLVSTSGASLEMSKQVAMHIAASNPLYINSGDMPAKVVEGERKLKLDIALLSGKPKEIAERMVEERMAKFAAEISLLGQSFVVDPSKTVGQVLKGAGADVLGFLRYEVGESLHAITSL